MAFVESRTPFRVSFLGGGTDFPDWYRAHDGLCVSAAIDKYCYVRVRRLPPFFDHANRIVWSRVERTNRVEDIEHPAVREALRFTGFEGVEMQHSADIPARSGMGSSSAFVVGLLNALYAVEGYHAEPRQLAEDAIYLERTVMGEAGGLQDQIAAAYGGLNALKFHGGMPEFTVKPLRVPFWKQRQLEQHCQLFWTGMGRDSAHIVPRDLSRLESQLYILQQLAEEGYRALTGTNGSLKDFGRLLHEAWRVKRNMSSRVTTPELDDLYERARRAGAIGGKLLGAGGGGMLLTFSDPQCRPAIEKALEPLVHIPFHFEGHGSVIR